MYHAILLVAIARCGPPNMTGLLGGAAIAAGALIGGVLLWDILLRGQQGF